MDKHRFWIVFFMLVGCDCGGSDISTRDASTSDASGSDGSSDASAPDASTSVAATLAGLRWEMPCTGDVNTWNCTASDPAPVVTTLGGVAGTTYQVTLWFRGVVEGKTYDGGTTVGRINSGGTAANDGFNVYELRVSDPAQSYFLNAGTSGVGNCLAIDYTATIAIAAGATVSLIAGAVDGIEHKNMDDLEIPIVVPGVLPDPSPYDGQFVQMDVVSVTE